MLDLIESQPGRETKGRADQNKPPFPSQSKLLLAPSKLPHPSPKLTLLLRTEPTDPKRKRKSKGKEVMKVKKSRPTLEKEAHQATKQ